MRAVWKVFIGIVEEAVIISQSSFFYAIWKNPEILSYVNTLVKTIRYSNILLPI